MKTSSGIPIAEPKHHPLSPRSLRAGSVSKIPRRGIASLVFFVLCWSSVALTANAEETDLHWQELEFKGSKLFISLSSAISRTRISAASAQAELLQPENLIAKKPDQSSVLKTQIKTKVLGNESVYTLWQNPNLDALQRTTLYSGFRNWYRNYRFLPESVYSTKIEPASGEEDKRWQQWTNIRQSEHEYKPNPQSLSNQLSTKPLTGSAAIFNVLADNKLTEIGDATTLVVFNRRGNFAVTLRVTGQQTIKADYAQWLDGKKTRKKLTRQALVIKLEPTFLQNGSKDQDFKFLGYKGDISIHYDPLHNLPLRLSGEVDVAGRVTIYLEKVRFTRSPDEVT